MKCEEQGEEVRNHVKNKGKEGSRRKKASSKRKK